MISQPVKYAGLCRRIALILEYDGTNYAGFQLQDNKPTIQGEVEKALTGLTLNQTRIHGAGRTDAGVHAKAQVAAFATDVGLPCDTFVRGINHFLPTDIAVQSAYEVSPDFDPRRDAKSRTYRYTILCRSTPSPLEERHAFRVEKPLDVDAMNCALKSIEGIHDFSRLTVSPEPGTTTVREVFDTQIWEDHGTITFEIKANAFLRHQMRRIAGMLVQTGSQQMSMGSVRAILDDHSKTNRQSAIPTLPPQGLCLINVAYEDFPPNEHQT